jgi:uncharacterized protein (DUF1330 family)
MPKGYWIAAVDVQNPDAYKNYVSANGVAFARFGGRFLVRGGPQREVVEGKSRTRNVVIEFPSYEAAIECFHSPEYQAALRAQAGSAEVDLIVIEGYDGPQPG